MAPDDLINTFFEHFPIDGTFQMQATRYIIGYVCGLQLL